MDEEETKRWIERKAEGCRKWQLWREGEGLREEQKNGKRKRIMQWRKGEGYWEKENDEEEEKDEEKKKRRRMMKEGEGIRKEEGWWGRKKGREGEQRSIERDGEGNVKNIEIEGGEREWMMIEWEWGRRIEKKGSMLKKDRGGWWE